jgi:hypothetical protein
MNTNFDLNKGINIERGISGCGIWVKRNGESVFITLTTLTAMHEKGLEEIKEFREEQKHAAVAD